VEGGGVLAHASEEVVLLEEERLDDLAGGVVGVGDQEEGVVHAGGDRQEEGSELVEEGALVAIGEDQTFVDAGDEGDGGDMSGEALDEQGEGLEGMAHEVLGFGVVGGLVVEGFDRGHLAAFFGDLDPIGDADEVGAGGDGREEGEDQADPGVSEIGQSQGGGMEEVEETPVGGVLEPGSADETGDPPEVGSNAEADQGEGEPEEGGGAGAGGTQGLDAPMEFDPQCHGALLFFDRETDSIIVLSCQENNGRAPRCRGGRRGGEGKGSKELVVGRESS
jgi:hypothetical protein